MPDRFDYPSELPVSARDEIDATLVEWLARYPAQDYHQLVEMCAVVFDSFLSRLTLVVDEDDQEWWTAERYRAEVEKFLRDSSAVLIHQYGDWRTRVFERDRFLADVSLRVAATFRSWEYYQSQLRWLEHAAPSGLDRPSAEAPSDLSDEIERLRLQAKMSVLELADAVGIDRTNVDDHRTGKSTPRRPNIAMYEQVFTKKLGRPVALQSLARRIHPTKHPKHPIHLTQAT